MAPVYHLIQKQNLQLSFYGEAAPEQLSVQLSRWVNEQLLPAMEMVLDDLDLPRYRLQIDTLTIDAGEIEGEEWERWLTEKICRLLRQQIAEASSVKIPLLREENKEQSLMFYSPAEKQKLVLTYLQSGTLPWYASIDVSELMEWLQQMVKDGFFSRESGMAYLKENRSAFQRFLRQSKPALLETWTNQWLTDEQQTWLPGIIAVARQLFGTSHTALEWTYALLFDSVHAGQQPSEPLTQLTRQLVEKQIDFRDWQEKVTALKIGGDDQTPATKPSEADAYFIRNAGLVLLHPFLQLFFEKLDFLNGSGVWRSSLLHRRSVLLLHYLCTGNTEVAEYELPLGKLLVGYPFVQPVEAAIDVTNEEAAEAKALLRNVIDQWAILKSTSVEGLRHSFLAREGKLSRQDNGWLLQVEQKSFDILLSHLPWGIGVIKNSWMEAILFTEWT